MHVPDPHKGQYYAIIQSLSFFRDRLRFSEPTKPWINSIAHNTKARINLPMQSIIRWRTHADSHCNSSVVDGRMYRVILQPQVVPGVQEEGASQVDLVYSEFEDTKQQQGGYEHR